MALTITKTDVISFASELSVLSDADWSEVLRDAADEVGPGVCGSQQRADRMGAWLAAHLGTVRYLRKGGSAQPGALVSVSVGSVSKSYAAPAETPQSLTSTKYGQEYLRLVRLFGRRMAVT